MATAPTEQFGKRLLTARTKRGLTMFELAAKAKVSTALINDAEKGRHSPSIDKVHQLAKALGVDACWLAYGTGDKPDWLNQAE
jgi:transcriptional regulator with XRE-family HTH domain